MSDLNELKEIAYLANEAGQGSPAMVEFRVSATPDVVIVMINQLEAAQQRITELKESFDDLAEAVGWSAARCEQIGDSPLDCANELANELASAQLRIVELEAEADREDGITIDALDSMREWRLRAETAESEIKLRDAAAGEPYGYVHKGVYEMAGSAGLSSDIERSDCPSYIPLYAAQPSALPPERKVSTNLNRFEIAENIAYNQAIADAKALGCKAIKLPPTFYSVLSGGKAAMREASDGHWLNKTAVIEALTERGFTVEGE
jgi:hypothetical protein